MDNVNYGDNVLSEKEVDMLLTMDKEEAEFFNARIKFGECNIMHVDNFVDDNTVDIHNRDLVKGSGLLGTKPVFNSDGIFIPATRVFKNHYEPRMGGPIFHYVKTHGDIRELKHYDM